MIVVPQPLVVFETSIGLSNQLGVHHLLSLLIKFGLLALKKKEKKPREGLGSWQRSLLLLQGSETANGFSLRHMFWWAVGLKTPL